MLVSKREWLPCDAFKVRDRRCAARLPTDLSVTLQVPAGTFTAVTLNLSRTGILLGGEATAKPGEACQMHIFSAYGLISAQGDVVRADSGEVAVRFREMSDAHAALVELILANVTESLPRPNVWD